MRLFPGRSRAHSAPASNPAGDDDKTSGSREGERLEKAVDPEAIAYDLEIEKRVVRKQDLHLVTLVTALYLLAFLDRSNIGNAEIAGLQQDLNLYGDRYEWLLTIFYIAYVVFEPLILLVKLLPPHYWISSMIFVWGVCATCLAAVDSWAGAMVLRFLLGVAEAAFGTGIVYFLTFWYRRDELGLRQGFYLAAAPLASTFAGALAYGITSGRAAIAPWRLLFLVEGLPTVCMAAVAFLFLPDSPVHARFFTPEERGVARLRGLRQAGTKESRVGGFDLRAIGLVALDARAWFTALMYFSCNVAFASLPVYLPTLLSALGFTKINAQGLSAPPYFFAFLVTILTVWVADRTQQRAFMIMGLTLVGSVGYVILATATQSVGARYFATFLVAGGVFPAIGNILPWVSNNQGSDERRGLAYVLVGLVGQCGPILGTRLYPMADSPDFVTGHSVCAGFLFFTTCLAGGLRVLLKRENARLDRQYGPVRELRQKLEEEGQGTVGEENYGALYRYIL